MYAQSSLQQYHHQFCDSIVVVFVELFHQYFVYQYQSVVLFTSYRIWYTYTIYTFNDIIGYGSFSSITISCLIIHFLISYILSTRVVHWVDLGILVFRTGIFWYRSGNTSCQSGNSICLSGTNQSGWIPYSILPVLVIISTWQHLLVGY